MSVHPVALDAVANALIRIMRRVERRYAQRPYLELAAHGNNMYRGLSASGSAPQRRLATVCGAKTGISWYFSSIFSPEI